MLEELTDNSIEDQRRLLRFLLERVGHNNLPKLLNYYTNIAWISPAIADKLLELSDREKRYTGSSWTLSPEEHSISRLYIEKLKGGKINESLLAVSLPAKAKPDPTQENQPENIHPAEKNKMEFAIHRREVTITNLENELKDKDAQIGELKEKITELVLQLDGCHKELQKDRIYRGILDQNIRLKSAVFRGKQESL